MGKLNCATCDGVYEVGTGYIRGDDTQVCSIDCAREWDFGQKLNSSTFVESAPGDEDKIEEHEKSDHFKKRNVT